MARAVDVGAHRQRSPVRRGDRAGASETDPNSVAASQMPLVLVGTIANTDPELGYAIIGESSAAAKVYAVGKTITGGTKLHSVYPDRAIIDRGGKLEALLLPKRFTGQGMNAGLATARRSAARRHARRTAAPARRAEPGGHHRDPAAATCVRERRSNAATACTRAVTARSSTSSACCPATSSRPSTARRSTTRRAAWKSCRP